MARPRLVLWLVLYLSVSYGLLAMALAIFGKQGSFEAWALLPALLSGILFGARIQREGSSRGI